MADPGADPRPLPPAAEEPAASHVLRLYVAGNTARSGRTVATARRLLESRIPGRYTLAVVDIYQDPEGARVHQIVAVPTLIRLRPLPVRRLVGDLSNEARVLAALGLDPAP
ncbi:MAG: circadian clock KaiB family protein [Janthinobacterium lividum]